MDIIQSELSKVGLYIDDIYDLVNTKKPYPEAIPVLLILLAAGIDDVKTREGVIRSLAVKEAIGKAGPILLAEYLNTPNSDMGLKWVIGNSVYETITSNDLDGVISIVEDKNNGMSRQMFVMALGKIKSDKSENTLISLLDDDEVIGHAIIALGKLKSKKAEDKIKLLTNHPKTFIRNEAIKALKRINK